LRLFRQQNVWNELSSIHQAFEQLFTQFRNSTMAISYRSNGIPTIDELVGILECLGKNVKIYQSSCIKYVLSNKQSNEVLIVAS
jgi:adenine-specific DNA methylase